MTLNGVMTVFCVISATSVAFSALCVKVVEASSFSDILLMAIFAADHPATALK